MIQVCLTLSYIQDHCHYSCSCHTNCKHQNAGSRSLNPWIRNGAHTLSTAPLSTRDYSNPIPVTTHKETFHEDLKQRLCWIFFHAGFYFKSIFWSLVAIIWPMKDHYHVRIPIFQGHIFKNRRSKGREISKERNIKYILKTWLKKMVER